MDVDTLNFILHVEQDEGAVAYDQIVNFQERTIAQRTSLHGQQSQCKSMPMPKFLPSAPFLKKMQRMTFPMYKCTHHDGVDEYDLDLTSPTWLPIRVSVHEST